MYRIAFDPEYILPLPPGHRFPMLKYDLIPRQLMYEGTIEKDYLFTPCALNYDVAARVHEESYLNKLLSLALSPKEVRRSGFPLSEELIRREFLIAGGTLQCCTYAFENGIAFNVAGGTHHAFSNRAEGFCLLNDCAIAAAQLLAEAKASRILIVDLDVHQGNGTASIFRNESRVFTFSMHGAANYPLEKEMSDLDVPLADATDDASYLQKLEESLTYIDSRFTADFMFYIAGADVLHTDKLGRLKLTREGARTRDSLVMNYAKARHIPMVVTMGGGYSEKITDIVEAHCNTYRMAKDLYL